MDLTEIIAKCTREYLNEYSYSNNLNSKIKCIQTTLKGELSRYNNENKDDRWADIKSELKRIDNYLKDGFFLQGRNRFEEFKIDFLTGLDYSDTHTYTKGNIVGELAKSADVYKATGNKILFRGVSLIDWGRIQKQGYIDSDMRRTIFDNEGINLGQTYITASYYLPHNSRGVILAINPKGLELYMLSDEYIRVFKPIPIKNIIKVTDVITTDTHGAIISTKTELDFKELVGRLKLIGINVNCK